MIVHHPSMSEKFLTCFQKAVKSYICIITKILMQNEISLHAAFEKYVGYF